MWQAGHAAKAGLRIGRLAAGGGQDFDDLLEDDLAVIRGDDDRLDFVFARIAKKTLGLETSLAHLGVVVGPDNLGALTQIVRNLHAQIDPHRGHPHRVSMNT